MSKTKIAIKRKYPSYRIEQGRNGAELWSGGTRIVTGLSMCEAEGLRLVHNVMRDEYIKASELLVEIEENWSL